MSKGRGSGTYCIYLKLGNIHVTSIENIKPSKAIEIGIATKRIKYFMETQQNHRNRTN